MIREWHHYTAHAKKKRTILRDEAYSAVCWITAYFNTFFKIDFFPYLGTLGHASPPPEMLWLNVNFWLENQAVKFKIGRILLKGVKSLQKRSYFAFCVNTKYAFFCNFSTVLLCGSRILQLLTIFWPFLGQKHNFPPIFEFVYVYCRVTI